MQCCTSYSKVKTVKYEYPQFDVSVDSDKNTFRWINMNAKPAITNGKEAISLLENFANIIQYHMKCQGDDQRNFSLTENEITRIIQNKTAQVVCESQNFPFLENINSLLFNDLSRINLLKDEINNFATSKIGIFIINDAISVVSDSLDRISASRFLRTCKKMHSFNQLFTKKLETYRPLLEKKRAERLKSEREAREQAKAEHERRMERRAATMR